MLYRSKAKYNQLDESTIKSLVQAKNEIDQTKAAITAIKGTSLEGVVVMKELSQLTPPVGYP